MTKKLTPVERYNNHVQKLHAGFVARFEALKFLYPALRIKHDGQHETWSDLTDLNVKFRFYMHPVAICEEFDEELVDAGPVTYEFDILHWPNDPLTVLYKEKYVDGRERITLFGSRYGSHVFKNIPSHNVAWANKLNSFIKRYEHARNDFEQEIEFASEHLRKW